MRSACAKCPTDVYKQQFNPLTLTVAIWVQLYSILCQTGLSHHLYFFTYFVALMLSPVKNYKWRLNLVWLSLLYSCTMAAVSVEGLTGYVQ